MLTIEYSEENWKNIKPVVDYLREKGFDVEKRKESLMYDVQAPDEWYLVNYEESFQYKRCPVSERTILIMPQDFDKLKSYFEDEMKRGEIYKVTHPTNDTTALCRFKIRSEDKIGGDPIFKCISYINYVDVFWINNSLGLSNFEKATPEESQKLIEAEHKNGWHWNGEDLVEIPEYVEIIDSLPCNWYKTGEIYRIYGVGKGEDVNIGEIDVFYDKKDSKSTYINVEKCKPSTKEAYEAQNKPNLEKGKWYKLNHTSMNMIGLYLSKDLNVGFYDDEWMCNISMIKSNHYLWGSADMTKVKELLIKEAEKRGYLEYKHKHKEHIRNKCLGFDVDFDWCEIGCVHDTGSCNVIFRFDTGKWAKIIKPSYEELEKENKELKEKLDKISDVLK